MSILAWHEPELLITRSPSQSTSLHGIAAAETDGQEGIGNSRNVPVLPSQPGHSCSVAGQDLQDMQYNILFTKQKEFHSLPCSLLFVLLCLSIFGSTGEKKPDMSLSCSCRACIWQRKAGRQSPRALLCSGVALGAGLSLAPRSLPPQHWLGREALGGERATKGEKEAPKHVGQTVRSFTRAKFKSCSDLAIATKPGLGSQSLSPGSSVSWLLLFGKAT